jgi:two-component system response regulator VicR
MKNLPAKVLYVEDEPFLSKIVKESLESRGYEVCLVMDGAKVLPALKDFRPDLCVLDVMLPNVDGFSLGRVIKEMEPELPILYLTAKDQTADVLEGFAAGGNDYLRKPCSLEELVVRIQNLLMLANRKPLSKSPEEVSLGDYQFNRLKYELRYKDGSSRQLSHKEVELLKLFSQHINQKIERQLILDTVWGDDSFFNSRNLDVYITKLRRYFKKDPKIQIKTLRGVGYRFVVG